MNARIGMAAAATLLSLLPGCGMYYSRVGGTAHDKLYRGTPEEVAKAVESALARHGFSVERPEAAGETMSLLGTIQPSESVSVRIRPGAEGLIETRIGSEVDWRKAVEIHRWIATELGVLYRREK